MNMFEEARAISGTLALCKITQEELARRLGVSQSYIANKLRLLSLPDDLARRICECGISERHARALLRVRQKEVQAEILEKVITRRLTVRECEALVDAAVDREAPRVIIEASRKDRIAAFRDTLGESISTLCSLGVDASARTGYYGNKMYITICICDV